MQIRLSSISSLLLILSAMLVPVYFSNFRLMIGGLILRPADVMGLMIIALFLFCSRHDMAKLYLPKGFSFIVVFLIYCFLNALIQSGVFKALIATFQWTMILANLAIAYS
jgi:hypothetical protein